MPLFLKAEGDDFLAEETILRAESISKSFGGVKALQNVSFSLKMGEVLSVIGENARANLH